MKMREALECGREAAAFSPASLLAAIARTLEIPASKLAGRKAAASRPHSKASHRKQRAAQVYTDIHIVAIFSGVSLAVPMKLIGTDRQPEIRFRA